jgi:hypothetical protein
MAPYLGSRAWQDGEVFERSNKRLNEVAPIRPLRDGSGVRGCGLRAALDLGPVVHETLAIQFLQLPPGQDFATPVRSARIDRRSHSVNMRSK